MVYIQDILKHSAFQEAGNEETWVSWAEAWRALGATHLCANTLNAGFHPLQEHINALHRGQELLLADR